MKEKKKFYIAFSISGTNTFITASIETADYIHEKDISGKNIYLFSIEPKLYIRMLAILSRRPNYKPEDGIKLSWELLNNKKGKPLRSPARISACFNKLKMAGWTVDNKKFNHYHYSKKRER